MSNSLRRKLLTRSPFLPTAVYVRSDDEEEEEFSGNSESRECAAHDSFDPEHDITESEHDQDQHEQADLDTRLPDSEEASESPFQILPKDKIEEMIDHTLTELSKLLSIPSGDVGLLLRVFKYDRYDIFITFVAGIRTNCCPLTLTIKINI
jgi:hypothetical protein